MRICNAAPEFLAALGPLADFTIPITMYTGRRARVEEFLPDGTVVLRYLCGEKEQVTVTQRFLQKLILMEGV